MSSKTQTTATKEETRSVQVPKLRFREFQTAGEWEIEALGELADYENGKAYEQDIVENGKYVVVNSRFISTDGVVRKYTNAEHLIAKAGEVLMVLSDLPKGRALAKCYFVERDDRYAVNQRVCRLKPRRIDGKFLYYTLNRHPRLLAYDDGLNQTHLSKGGVTECPLCVPMQKAEQQKIAECLSSVDELMATQARKVDALKTHKKGLMQQLFPREGETQPRLRFPEFQNAGEWEAKTLGDVVKSFKTGKLDANAMVENGQYRFYTCAKNYYQIDHYAFEGEALLVAGNGAHLGYIHHYIGKFNAYQRTYVLQDFKANVVFLRSLLDRYLPARIQFEKKDGNTPYIVLSTLTEMPLVIPRDPDEQQRIATCLSSLDALITAETQKHEALMTHKKGLMQQLFPAQDEEVA